MEHSSEVNENNNIFINILKHNNNRKEQMIKQEPFEMIKQEPPFEMSPKNHLKSLKQFNRNVEPKLLDDETMFKVENSEQQLMMLQPLLGLYIQNKYIDDFLRKTQSTYFNQLSKLMRQAESPPPLPPMPPQEHPLDLSLKSERNIESPISPMEFDTILKNPVTQFHNFMSCSNPTTPTELSNVYSRTLNNLVSSSRSNDQLTESDSEISNVIQNIVKEEETVFSCGICNQVFNIRDRLAKHIASCHKNKKKQSDITKTYECDVCKRSFARSDMLTRHSRLHTGECLFIHSIFKT